jgi:hypothetical protein
MRGVAASKLGSESGLRDWVYRDDGVCRVSADVVSSRRVVLFEVSFLVY